jgi:hypothetical protein
MSKLFRPSSNYYAAGDLVEFSSADFACWKNYEQFGSKNKGGKLVPNCIPRKKKKKKDSESKITN